VLDPSSHDHLTDKMNHSHLLEIVDSLEPREVGNRECSMKVDSSGDTPCAGEVHACEEGRSVFRNVVDDVVDDLLGKAYISCFAYPEDPTHLPCEVFAAKPKHVRRLLGIYSRRGTTFDALIMHGRRFIE
jgi:hypothetical protein